MCGTGLQLVFSRGPPGAGPAKKSVGAEINKSPTREMFSKAYTYLFSLPSPHPLIIQRAEHRVDVGWERVINLTFSV